MSSYCGIQWNADQSALITKMQRHQAAILIEQKKLNAKLREIPKKRIARLWFRKWLEFVS